MTAKTYNQDNLIQQAIKVVQLEQLAPHGRCSLCNLALFGNETLKPDEMHDTCAEAHYE